MDANEQYALIAALEEKIAVLPVGYISRKTINGKTQYYHQWTENGKIKSKYIKEGELEPLESAIEQRRSLQAQLKKLRAGLPPSKGLQMEFECNVTLGAALSALSRPVADWQRRDSFDELRKFLYSNSSDRVLVLYGLRRTGKTTMLRQAIAEMSVEDQAKAVYMKLRRTDTIDMVDRDLRRLHAAGYRFIFLDEVTLMKDFIDSAALFSDVYAAMGMKLVLSGTDSLGFWLAQDDELYDRARMIHTTEIPFHEYSRLLGIDSIDDYIRYGGTLRMGETAFGDPDARAEDASFRDDESTRRYINTAISKNIQHSLSCCKDGGQFHHLYSLYEKNELTNAINRIIEDMNHRFVVEVLTRDFQSSDLHISDQNMRRNRDPEKRMPILDIVDEKSVTQRLMELLELRNKNKQSVDILPEHIAEIKTYLKALDLITDCPIEYAGSARPAMERIIFTQPGMRYCQAEALVYSLMQDETFRLLGEATRSEITERILEEVRGRMMEDIVLLETAKALGKRYRVFKLSFEQGEYDMVIYDREQDQCAIAEIKHSKEAVPAQARHLLDDAKCALTELQYGAITGRYVIYRGETMTTDDGIGYCNVEEYLKALPTPDLLQNMSQAQQETEDPFPDPTMTM